MRLQQYLINEMGARNITTVYHEIFTAIYLIDRNAKLDNSDDILKYFERSNIVAVNSGLSPLRYDDILKGYSDYFSEDTISKFASTIKEAKEDAKKVAKAISNKIAVADKVLWTGPTNDSSKYGAADIVVISKGKEYPISLKKGKGVLKNLGMNTIGDILLKGVIDGNLIDNLFSNELMEYWDELTAEWTEMFAGADFGDENLNDVLGSYAIGYGWNEFQKMKIDNDKYMDDPENSIPGKQYVEDFYGWKFNFLKELFAKSYEKNKQLVKQWTPIKKTIFEKIFKTFFNDKEDIINQNLKKFFKSQMSINSKMSLWYASEGGKKVMLIPSDDIFDKASNDLLEFKIKSASTGSGYKLTIIVTGKYVNIDFTVMEIDIILKWSQGQMVNTPMSNSSMKMKIKDKEWNQFFRPFI